MVSAWYARRMTSKDVFEQITHGGATDFARIIAWCEASGGYCLIGGLAVNCYVEPVYTLDADLVVSTAQLGRFRARGVAEGFVVEDFEHSLNIQAPASDLRIQFTKDTRYQDFVTRAVTKEIFGVSVRVAALPDLLQGKIWAWEDATRRLSKRQKDQADLVRIVESYPELSTRLPSAVQQLFEKK